MKHFLCGALCAILIPVASAQAATIVRTGSDSGIGIRGVTLNASEKTATADDFALPSLFDLGLDPGDVNAVTIEGVVTGTYSAAAFGEISLTDTESRFVARLHSGSTSRPVKTELGTETRTGTFDGAQPVICDGDACPLGQIVEEVFRFSTTFTGDDISAFQFSDPFGVFDDLAIAVSVGFDTGRSDPGVSLLGQASLTADLTLFYFTGDDVPGGGGGGGPDSPSEIPLPAAGWLLVAGLGAFGALRRRR